MTATRSLMLRTTARSWLINTKVSENRAFIASRRLMIWAWIETSSAETGSSQMSTLGSRTRARAMLMRWH